MTVDFVVIGAQKAGSTFLHAALRRHPQVCMPRNEVPYFEDPEYRKQSPATLARIASGRAEGQIVGIKRPDYLARPECPPRIARDLPNAKLIACLRDPVDRALSAYYYYMLLGFLPVAPPEEGLRAILAGSYDGVYPRARDVVEYGRYGQQVQRYLQSFPPAALKIVFSDDLRDQPTEVLGEIHRFLGVDPSPVLPSVNAKEGINSLAMLKIFSRLQPVLYRYEAGGRRAVPRIRGVPGTLMRLAARYERRAKWRRAPVDYDVIALLAAEYAQDLDMLAEILDRPLPDWPSRTQRHRAAED